MIKPLFSTASCIGNVRELGGQAGAKLRQLVRISRRSWLDEEKAVAADLQSEVADINKAGNADLGLQLSPIATAEEDYGHARVRAQFSKLAQQGFGRACRLAFGREESLFDIETNQKVRCPCNPSADIRRGGKEGATHRKLPGLEERLKNMGAIPMPVGQI